MNKRQKEVIAASLDDEKAVLQALEKNYTTALADIKKNIKELQANPLTQSKAYQLEFQKQLEKQLSGILDNLQGKNFTSIADYLNTCYNEGFLGSMYDMQGQGVPLVLPIDQKQVLKAVQKTGDDFKLSNKLGVSTKKLKKQVQAELTRGLATEKTYAEIARNISNYGLSNMNRSKTIARTEGHRVQNAARYDSMNAAKSKGADIVKQWDSTLDGNTRHTHAQLDGQIRELDENFEVSGKSAPCPGGFGDPAEDCNCRCAMLQRARWAVKDETSYNKWNNETGGIIECKGYDDFKEKFIKNDKVITKVAKKIEDAPTVVPSDRQQRMWDKGKAMRDEVGEEYSFRSALRDVSMRDESWADYLEGMQHDKDEAFFKAGFIDRQPEYVQAVRFGEIPESGKSTNWATMESEGGVSTVGILRDGNTDIASLYDYIYGVQGTDKLLVEGWYFGFAGSDGEPLIHNAKVIGKITQ